MNRVIEFSKYLNYQGIYVDTFSNNMALMRILDKVGGFTKVGYLPLGGLMKNGNVVSSLIYYRDLANG
jgi:RimJ/RimL family protein N-acetyltransferase